MIFFTLKNRFLLVKMFSNFFDIYYCFYRVCIIILLRTIKACFAGSGLLLKMSFIFEVFLLFYFFLLNSYGDMWNECIIGKSYEFSLRQKRQLLIQSCSDRKEMHKKLILACTCRVVVMLFCHCCYPLSWLGLKVLISLYQLSPSDWSSVFFINFYIHRHMIQ